MKIMLKTKVVIIGCGAAGIGAARILHERGIEYLVLESTNRYGGRVKDEVVYHPEDENTWIRFHMGANWIHGLNSSHNPMTALANQLSIPLYPTSSDDEPGDDVLLYTTDSNSSVLGSSTNYHIVSQETYHEVLSRYEWIKENMDIYSNLGQNQYLNHNYNQSLQDVFERGLIASEVKYGSCNEVVRKCFNWLFDRVSIDLGTNLSNVSANEYRGSESDGAEGEALVIGGYLQLLKRLYEEYKLNVKFNHIVKKISYDVNKKDVWIECENGFKIIADKCLVTIPIGVLSKNSIDYSPSIPSSIQNICNRCQPGLMNIIWFWFETQFWPSGYNFFGITRDSKELSQFSTFLVPPILDNHGNRQPVLMCQIIGDYAIQIESMTNTEIIKDVTNVLKKVFTLDEIPKVLRCHHSNWWNDPYTCCSWSYGINRSSHSLSTITEQEEQEENHIPGVISDDSDHLVYYAGEATNEEYRGTVHGAYLSGQSKSTLIADSIYCSSQQQQQQQSEQPIN